MSTIPGLHVLGEANFSDHGANRLGASALMQGLADGYFVIPNTLGEYLSTQFGKKVSTDMPEFKNTEQEVRDRVEKLLSVKGRVPADEFHRLLGLIMWDQCGMARSKESLEKAISEIRALRERFWKEIAIPGTGTELNQSLERAGRVADFLEFGELLCLDALTREESCGGHFRVEHQTPEGEALRHDDKFAEVFAWMFQGEGNTPELVREPLHYEAVHLATRSYK